VDSLGKHILAEFYNCNSEILNDTSQIEDLMVLAAEQAGATIISTSFHHFSPFGVSGVVVIQESHLAIHTWPEYHFAAVDLFTCGESTDPWQAFEFLKEKLFADKFEISEKKRGQKEQLEFQSYPIENSGNRVEDGQPNRSIWFTNKDENLAISLRIRGKTLFDERSEFQRTRVFDTFGFGKIIATDNKVICTERDEKHYHEMISHPAIFAHGNVNDVLVIGGGDGGTVREVLRHKSVENVSLVEIDANVVNASKQHMPQLSSGLKDERLNLTFQDGIEYVKSVADEMYDLVIVDGSDPAGPSEGLFTESFYMDCKRILRSDGILVTQGESPDFNTGAFVDLNTCLKNIFGAENVDVMLFHIATYPAGIWSFQIAQKSSRDLKIVSKENIDSFVQTYSLQFYNYSIHKACFALPNYVMEMLH
jgi:spermidine synthase